MDQKFYDMINTINYFSYIMIIFIFSKYNDLIIY